MQSIKQKTRPALEPGNLPDFRNLGVLLRLVLLVNLILAVTVLVQTRDPQEFIPGYFALAGLVELPLLSTVLVLYVLSPWLAGQSRRAGGMVVMGLVTVAAMLTWWLMSGLSGEGENPARWVLWAWGAGGLALLYFDYRNQRLSPALTEARLMALTARIRPHFLFNSLNAVLGVIRSDPARAEQAVEELAELFRVLMRENRKLVRLESELDLCKRYLDIEYLRLGERLRVNWHIEHCPRDALVPSLLLQPLLENAVYHGIEPLAEPGEILVQIYQRGKELRIEVDNPIADENSHHTGNRMALDNLRERLMLFFDLEADLEILRNNKRRYRVRIRMPYRRAEQ